MSLTVRRKYLDSRFGQVHCYLARPEGPPRRRPVVCFHMSPWSGKYFEPLLAELGRDRVAVAMDTPGYGNSDQPTAQPEMADYAATAGELAAGLGLDEFDVFGDRTGAKIALAVAVTLAPKVRNVVLGSPVIWTPEQLSARRDYPREPISPDGSHLSALWRLSVAMSMEERSLDRSGDIFYTRMQNMHLQHWGRRAAARFDAATALQTLSTTRVLVLNPNDDLWGVAHRTRPYLAHPDSRILDLEDWGYGYIEVRARELATLLRDFLDEASA